MPRVGKAMDRKRNARVQRTDASVWPHPSGTPVWLKLDDGTEVETCTRSGAWNLLGITGQGVVQVEGRSSCWDLSRVRLRTDSAQHTEKGNGR